MEVYAAGGANSSTYDPIKSEITAANIEKCFRNSIVDPCGQSDTECQAAAVRRNLIGKDCWRSRK